jgi:hypothetical protein
MRKWSDIWSSPRGLLTSIVVLFCLYGVVNIEATQVFLDTLLQIMLNKVLPIAMVVAFIFFLLRRASGK